MSTTLNALVMKIRMDTREVSMGSRQVRQDVNRVSSIMRKAKTDAERYNEAKAALARRFEAGALSARKFRDGLAQIHQQYVSGPKRIEEERKAQERANLQKKAAANLARKKAEEERKAAESARIAAQAERELQRVRHDALSVLRRNESALDRYENETRNLRSALKKGAITQDEYNRAVRAAAQEYNKTALSGRNYDRQIGHQTSGLSAVAGRLVGIGIAVQAVRTAFRAATATFRAGMELEKARAAFEIYTGSLERGNRVLGELRALAASTPLEFEQLQRAGQVMLSFGVAADELTGTLKQLGDIAAGDNERFQRLALAMSQVSAAGRLMGQDLNQLIQAGFNPLQEISRTTGRSHMELRKAMENGEITFQMVKDAMASITSEGGRANNAMNKFAETTSGSISILVSEFNALVAVIGESSSEMLMLGRMASDLAGAIRYIREFGFAVEEVDEQAKSAAKSVKEAVHPTFSSDDRIAKEVEAAKQLMQLVEERQALTMGEDFVAINRFAMSGATKAQQEEFRLLLKSIAKLKEKKKLEEAIAAENERRLSEINRLREQGQQMMRDNNPVQAVAKQLADLKVLLQINAIDQATYFREQNRILAEQASESRMEQPDAITAGSSEAASFLQKQLADKQNDQIQIMKMIELNGKAQVAATREAVRQLRELVPVEPAR